MLKKLKQSSIKKKFNKLLIEKEAEKNISQNEILSVGIICDNEISRFIDVKESVENILKPRNTKIYSFREYNRKDELSYHHFCEKDFNWKGAVSQPNFKVFIDQPFDLLIGYFNKPNLFLENAVLRSEAKFKAGFSGVNQNLYDIEVNEIPNKIESFLEELKRYLAILGKIKN